jgi:hypothetical protein
MAKVINAGMTEYYESEIQKQKIGTGFIVALIDRLPRRKKIKWIERYLEFGFQDMEKIKDNPPEEI